MSTTILKQQTWQCVFLLGQLGSFLLDRLSSPNAPRVLYNGDLP